MENHEWSFGTMQAKVKVEGEQLSWSLIGNGGSSYPLRSVSGIQFEKGSFMSVMGHIVILVSGGENRRIQVPNKDHSAAVVKNINDYVAAWHEANRPSSAPAAASSSVADELMKLANLRQMGVLTDAEFEQQKQRLLA